MLKLTPEEKSRIVGLSEGGLSAREISRRIGRHSTTVDRVLKKNLENPGSYERKKGSGSKKKTSVSQDRYILRMSLCDRFKTATEIRRDLEENANVQISVETVRRRLREGGLLAMKPAKKPLLTRKMKAARLKWAKYHRSWTVEDWKNVIFSDESKFNLHGSDGMIYVRRKEGERYSDQCTRKTVKHPAGKMVWGCFSFYGVGHLEIISGTVNAKKYIDILQRSLVPSLESHLAHADDVTFQDDSAPCHRAKIVCYYFFLDKTFITVI